MEYTVDIKDVRQPSERVPIDRFLSHVAQMLSKINEKNHSERYKRGNLTPQDLERASNTLFTLSETLQSIPQASGKDAYERAQVEAEKNPYPFHVVDTSEEGIKLDEMSNLEMFRRTDFGHRLGRIQSDTFDTMEERQFKEVIRDQSFNPAYDQGYTQ